MESVRQQRARRYESSSSFDLVLYTAGMSLVEENTFLADFNNVSKMTQRFSLTVLFFENGPWNFDSIEDGSTDWLNVTNQCAWVGVSCLSGTTQVEGFET